MPKNSASSWSPYQTAAHDDYGHSQCWQIHFDECAVKKTRGSRGGRASRHQSAATLVSQ